MSTFNPSRWLSLLLTLPPKPKTRAEVRAENEAREVTAAAHAASGSVAIQGGRITSRDEMAAAVRAARALTV